MYFLLLLPDDIFKLVGAAAILNILILLCLIIMKKGRAMSVYKLPICTSVLVTCSLIVLTRTSTSAADFTNFDRLAIRYYVALGFHQLTMMMILTVMIYVLTQTKYNRFDHSFRVISLIVLWISGVVYSVLTLGPLWGIVGVNLYDTLVYTIFALRAVIVLYVIVRLYQSKNKATSTLFICNQIRLLFVLIALLIEGPVYILIFTKSSTILTIPIAWSIVMVVILFLLSYPLEQFEPKLQDVRAEEEVKPEYKTGLDIRVPHEVHQTNGGRQSLQGQQAYLPQDYVLPTYTQQLLQQTQRQQAQRQQAQRQPQIQTQQTQIQQSQRQQAQASRQQAYIPQSYEEQGHTNARQSYERRGYEQAYVPQTYEPAYKPRTYEQQAQTYEPRTYESQTYESQSPTYGSRSQTYESQTYGSQSPTTYGSRSQTYESQTYDSQTYGSQSPTYGSRSQTYSEQDYGQQFYSPQAYEQPPPRAAMTNFAQGRPVHYSASSSSDE